LPWALWCRQLLLHPHPLLLLSLRLLQSLFLCLYRTVCCPPNLQTLCQYLQFVRTRHCHHWQRLFRSPLATNPVVRRTRTLSLPALLSSPGETSPAPDSAPPAQQLKDAILLSRLQVRQNPPISHPLLFPCTPRADLVTFCYNIAAQLALLPHTPALRMLMSQVRASRGSQMHHALPRAVQRVLFGVQRSLTPGLQSKYRGLSHTGPHHERHCETVNLLSRIDEHGPIKGRNVAFPAKFYHQR
jgi:hypothetical protein